MKLNRLILIILFALFETISAQHSIGFNYSGKIYGVNHNSASIITFEYSPNIINNRFKIGVEFSFIDANVDNDFINNPPNRLVGETELSVGVILRYFPLLGNKTVSPFLNTSVGDYFKRITFGISGNTLPCEESYHFDLNNNYYFNLGAGMLLFPESNGHVIIEIGYKFRYPKVTYQKPNCIQNFYYTEFTESVNLSMLYWKAGVQFDF